MSTTNQHLKSWVDEVAALTKPERIHWCDGSEAERVALTDEMLKSGTLIKLNEKTHPNCYLHRSDPTDVARTEHLTFICSKNKDDAGPNNQWMEPQAARTKMHALYAGCMRGRTMYVVPYVMGPIDSPAARCGVEISDSPYVVANMRIMTRMGAQALKRIEKDGDFVRGVHSLGDLHPDHRFIMHFPEEALIQSIGSGYGGNALLGKKCHALRIASWQGKTEGWLAEHMLIAGIEDPQGNISYIAAAFPSACGKTNLAMLIPPLSQQGYKVWTVGDDICWMHLGDDGRLWAINPEAGYFGVAPGTSEKTNPNALAMLYRDTIFTNTAMTKDRQPWWEGLTKEMPEHLIDWRGRPYDPENGPAAQPNSRFTVAAKQCKSYSPKAEDPKGVPISAIIFGGRRADVAPLVMEAKNWAHGVLMGASVASETTAAATGKVGVVRRDPMAMKPFCGYNMADYWGHWLSFGKKSDKLPKIFHVNWFRQDSSGRYMWPGFGENLRVLRWIIDRCQGRGSAMSTPIGNLPTADAIDTAGLNIDSATMQQLLAVDAAKWRAEYKDVVAYFDSFGARMPKDLVAEAKRIESELA